ncbi:MAG: winged helix-turn-helix domain-containing protein [Woeseiaceae bacterium]|jgi:two-component system, OmpR family, phosphate regulon response regulator PhoB
MTLASILVVDEDANSRALIAGGLRELGHYVSETENADSAMAEVRRSQPDLMIFVGKPTNLPGMLGLAEPDPAALSGSQSDQVFSAGGITIDTISHRVSVNDKYLSFAPREYRLLKFLLSHQERVFSREQLLVHVWDRDSRVGPRTVDVHIRRLRSALEPFDCDRYLQTVRGSGYRFSLNVQSGP